MNAGAPPKDEDSMIRFDGVYVVPYKAISQR